MFYQTGEGEGRLPLSEAVDLFLGYEEEKVAISIDEIIMLVS